VQLTRHFTLSEALQSAAAERLGIANTPTARHRLNIQHTATQMELVRAVLGGRPIVVTSWYRNPRVNKAVGGVPNSAHAAGLAVDFTARGLSVFDACQAIIASNVHFDQLINEHQRWIHIAFSRATPRLQVLTKGAGNRYAPGLQR